jgi:quinol monooxygenase YgiN
MIEKYESEQALSEHSQGSALADLLSAFEGKLTRDIDVQVLVPHPAGDARKGALP